MQPGNNGAGTAGRLNRIRVGVLGASGVAYGAFLVLLAWCYSFRFDGSPSYGRTAAKLLRDGWFDSGYRPPIYPLYLALMQSLFGESWSVAALLGQIVLSSLVCSSVVYLAGALVERVQARGRRDDLAFLRGAAVGFALWCLALTFHLEMIKQRETALYCAIEMAAVMSLLFIERWSYRALAVGFFAALAHLTRPDCIVPAVFLPMLLFAPSAADTRWGFRSERWKGFGLALALFAILFSPWALTIYKVSGKITPGSATTLGVNLWKGNNPYFYQYFPLIEVDRVEDKMREVTKGLPIEEVPGDDLLTATATEYILANPVSFVIRSLYKGVLFFSPIPIPLGTGPLVEREGKLVPESIKYVNPVQSLVFFLFSMALFAGCWLGLRNWKRLDWAGTTLAVVGLANLALSVALHMLLFFESRFRLPLDPFFVPLAAYGILVWLGSRASARARKSANAATKPGGAVLGEA